VPLKRILPVDWLQQESDDLLHNLLPDDVARRLISSRDRDLNADHHDGVSVAVPFRRVDDDL
jgi:hypothetical protein